YFLPIAWAYPDPVNEHSNSKAKTACEEQSSTPSMVAIGEVRRGALEMVRRARSLVAGCVCFFICVVRGSLTNGFPIGLHPVHQCHSSSRDQIQSLPGK